MSKGYFSSARNVNSNLYVLIPFWRESIDDAAVLRQELIQVQRVMDELTRERERERDQLKAELKQLKDQYVAREVTNISNEQIYNAEAQR